MDKEKKAKIRAESDHNIKVLRGMYEREKTHTFRFYVFEPGDPSVGIPAGEGPISITVPEWMIPEGDEGDFESYMAFELKKWTIDGVVMTSIQKIKHDEAEEKRALDATEGKL